MLMKRGITELVGDNGVRLGHRSNAANHFIQSLCVVTLDDILITTVTCTESVIRSIHETLPSVDS